MSEILDRPAPTADQRLAYGPEPLQFGDLRLPSGDGPFPVVVLIHGGFWRHKYDLEYMGHLAAALTGAGLATWTIEYRRLGDEGGGWPGTLQDVALALDFLSRLAQRFPVDPARALTLGHSAGGQLALWAAGRHRIAAGDELYTPDPAPIAAAVSIAGVSDLRLAAEWGLSHHVTEELMGGPPQREPARYDQSSPAALLPLGVPQVLVHGTEDENVPYEMSLHYRDLAQEAGDEVSLITLQGAGHFEPVDPDTPEGAEVVRVTAERGLSLGG